MLFTLLYGVAQMGAAAKMPYAASIAVDFVIGASLVAAYAGIVRLFEKRWTTTLNLIRFPGETARGMAIGVLYFIVVTGVIALCGCYKVDGVSYSRSLWQDLSFFFVVACGEEIMFRGIIFRLIDKKWGTAVALLVSALLFGLIHIGNSGATLWSSAAIAIEAGLLLGIAYKCSGTLWMPIGIHWTWNFMEGPILGFAVSGSDSGPTLVSPVIQGPDFISGGAFGAEASIIAAALGLALSLLMWHTYKKEKR